MKLFFENVILSCVHCKYFQCKENSSEWNKFSERLRGPIFAFLKNFLQFGKFAFIAIDSRELQLQIFTMYIIVSVRVKRSMLWFTLLSSNFGRKSQNSNLCNFSSTASNSTCDLANESSKLSLKNC